MEVGEVKAELQIFNSFISRPWFSFICVCLVVFVSRFARLWWLVVQLWGRLTKLCDLPAGGLSLRDSRFSNMAPDVPHKARVHLKYKHLCWVFSWQWILTLTQCISLVFLWKRALLAWLAWFSPLTPRETRLQGLVHMYSLHETSQLLPRCLTFRHVAQRATRTPSFSSSGDNHHLPIAFPVLPVGTPADPSYLLILQTHQVPITT